MGALRFKFIFLSFSLTQVCVCRAKVLQFLVLRELTWNTGGMSVFPLLPQIHHKYYLAYTTYLLSSLVQSYW